MEPVAIVGAQLLKLLISRSTAFLARKRSEDMESKLRKNHARSWRLRAIASWASLHDLPKTDLLPAANQESLAELEVESVVEVISLLTFQSLQLNARRIYSVSEMLVALKSVSEAK